MDVVGALLALALTGRTFHPVPLAKVLTHGHVEVCGTVVYARHQEDQDWHLTISDGQTQIVAEVIPELPLPIPKKGQHVRLQGLSRRDEKHGWAEVHPVMAIAVVASCSPASSTSAGSAGRGRSNREP